MGLTEMIIEIPAEHESNVFGQFDIYAKKIERTASCYIDCKRRTRQNYGRGTYGRARQKGTGTADGTFPARQHDSGAKCGLHTVTGNGRQGRAGVGN